jgi:hypothetical protein
MTEFFRRLFGGDPLPVLPPLNQPYEIIFHDGRSARAVRVEPTFDPARILRLLNVAPPRPTLFVSGGATDMSEQDRQALQAMFTGVVAPFAESAGLAVIDGGTSSGVMGMIGQARLNGGYTFLLIGAAPVGLIAYPGYDNPRREGELDSGHSHFALVDADRWGDETGAYMGMCRALAGEGTHPTVGIIVNGGKITQKEAHLATCVYHFPVLVLAGSGRFADELAAAVMAGDSADPVIAQIIASGQVELASIHDDSAAIRQRLAAHFAKSG